jgi:hypothetical protein
MEVAPARSNPGPSLRALRDGGLSGLARADPMFWTVACVASLFGQGSRGV